MATRPAVVLDIQWTEDGTARRETFGPWLASGDDDSHARQAAGFLRDWRQITGREPDAAMLTLVTDPAAWLDGRGGADG